MTLLDELVPFLRDFCGLDVRGPDDDLVALGLDSVMATAVLEFVETRSGRRIPAAAATREALSTPRRIAALAG